MMILSIPIDKEFYKIKSLKYAKINKKINVYKCKTYDQSEVLNVNI
jgi:hypothetical protein